MKKEIQNQPTRRQMLTGISLASLTALFLAGTSQGGHHEGGGGKDALKAKCKRLKKALDRAKRSGNRARARRLSKKLRACRRKLNA